MTVDGLENADDEIDAVRVPIGKGTVHGIPITAKQNRVTSDPSYDRLADATAPHAGH